LQLSSLASCSTQPSGAILGECHLEESTIRMQHELNEWQLSVILSIGFGVENEMMGNSFYKMHPFISMCKRETVQHSYQQRKQKGPRADQKIRPNEQRTGKNKGDSEVGISLGNRHIMLSANLNFPLHGAILLIFTALCYHLLS